MRTPARFGIVASLLVVAFAAACSDSTGPGTQSPAQIALHFDSIAIRAKAQSDTNGAYGVRTLLATLIEIPAALGATPSPVSVTTATGVESWKAYELLELTSNGTSNNDSSFAILMFRDADAHTAFIAFFDSTGAVQDGGLVTGDTIPVSPNAGTATTSLTSVGSACATPSSSLHNPGLASFTLGTCNLARFRTTLQLTLPSKTGVDAALTSLAFTNANMNGVRLVDAATGAAVRRIHEVIRASAAASRRY